jgi:lipopolysaccharide transport system permease protein
MAVIPVPGSKPLEVARYSTPINRDLVEGPAEHLITHTNSADSQLRHPWTLLRSMGRDLVMSRELAWRLFRRDLAARYRQTLLGYVWAILPPLVTSFAFIAMNSSNVVEFDKSPIEYAAFVTAGTIYFNLFLESFRSPIRLVTASQRMLARLNFPREAIFLAGIASAIFTFLISTLLLVGVLIFVGQGVQLSVLIAIVPLTGLLLLGTGLGVLIVPLGVLFQDVQHVINTLMFGLMLITPVAYVRPDDGKLATINEWNPLTPLIESARDLTFIGVESGMTPAIIVTGIGFLTLIVGWIVFRLAVPIFIERLGA